MLDAANQWLSRRIAANRARKQGRIMVDATGLHIVQEESSKTAPWQTIVEVTGIRKSAFIGHNIGLIIRAANGATLTVMEYDESWAALSQAISANLPGSLPYSEWSLKTAFTEPKGVVPIYRRRP
jgi:hypothetical protein